MPDDPRAVDVADVWKGDVLAATLVRERDRVRFAKVDGYDGPPVATSLRGPVPDVPAGAVPPFFAGLLPEGRRLDALRRHLKLAADDELSLLLAVGGDTIGDVRVAAQGATPRSPAPRYEAGEDVRFEQLVQASVSASPERRGLPGVQEKVSAQTANLPVRTGSRSDAILKFETGGFPRVVANEAACLAAARAAGLSTTDARVVEDAEGVPGLLVRRFDRVVRDGRLVAIAQEDACQVMGLWPADKYRPDLVEVVGSLAAVCAVPVVAALRLWEQVAFSYLAGNGDQHAKNLSVLRGERGLEPSPVYDVVFTHPYGDTETLALPLDGEARVARIDRARLLAAGESTGVRAPALARRLDRLLASTAELPDRLAAIGFPGQHDRKLRRVLEQRRQRLA